VDGATAEARVTADVVFGQEAAHAGGEGALECPGRPWLVTMMQPHSGNCVASCSATAMPSSLGICRSRTATSTRWLTARVTASSPFAALGDDAEVLLEVEHLGERGP
jgi:hypothetical protein